MQAKPVKILQFSAVLREQADKSPCMHKSGGGAEHMAPQALERNN
jgi:hypothetical protein